MGFLRRIFELAETISDASTETQLTAPRSTVAAVLDDRVKQGEEMLARPITTTDEANSAIIEYLIWRRRNLDVLAKYFNTKLIYKSYNSNHEDAVTMRLKAGRYKDGSYRNSYITDAVKSLLAVDLQTLTSIEGQISALPEAQTVRDSAPPRRLIQASKARIFMCYRREDSSGYSQALYDKLVTHFGAGQIYRDIDAPAHGVDFVERIKRTVSTSRVLLALIGKDWLTIRDKESGARRLDDPADMVRIEIVTAFQKEVPVLPVLFKGATMPTAEALPVGLAALSTLDAAEMSDRYWDLDVERLISSIEKISK